MATQYTAGLSAGDVLTAATMNQLGAAVATFTPTIVGSTSGSVTIGNGTLTGTYFQIQEMVIVFYTLVWGSTTTSTTSGLWLFSVPVGNALNGGGAGRILDAGNTYYRITSIASSNKFLFQGTDTGSEVQNGVPMTWANGDVLSATCIYRKA